MATARQLHIRLFLEGVEAPVVGAQIRATLGGAAAAQIQVIPTDRGMELLPGTMAHLFYLDTDDPGFEQVQEDGTAASTREKDHRPTGSQNRFYKLIFSGEVVGFHFVKQPSSRSLILQCMDTSKHWDTTYQYMLDASVDGNLVNNAANFTGSGSDFVNTGVDETTTAPLAALLVEGGPQTAGLEGAKGLLGGLIRMLEEVGGVAGQTRGINDFTTIAEALVKNLFQIAADSDDDSALQLLDATEFEDMLKGTLQQLGGRVSLRDIIRVINSIIYHDIAPNPAPFYAQGTAAAASYATADYAGAADVTLQAPERLHPRLVSFWDALKASSPPAGAKYSAGNSTRSAEDQMKAFRAGNSKARPGKSPHNYDKSLALDVYVIRGGKISNDPADYKLIGNMAEEMGLTWGGNWKSFRDVPHVQITAWRSAIGTSAQLGEEADPEPTPVTDELPSTELTDEDKRATARLLTQVFRPDIWYVPPPRCNVFFPENYVSFSYARNYLQEITRLQLSIGSELLGQDDFLSDYYYAPMIEALKEKLGTRGQLDDVFLLPHEKYSGIIPEFQSMQDVGFYLKKISDAEASATAKDKFAQQVAAFDFFKKRFSSRTLSVSGGYFTPFPVTGFPALVIQKGLPPIPEMPTSKILQMINEGDTDIDKGFLVGEDRVYLPTQFLGLVESVDHSITQSGGVTSLTMSHVRAHRSADGQDDEFLNHLITRAETTLTKVEVTTTLKVASPAYTEDPETLRIVSQVTPQGSNPELSRSGGGEMRVGSPGPQGGTITQIETSKQLVEGPSLLGLAYNLYTEVKIVEEVDASSSAAAKVKAADVRPPVEMVLAPPWVSDLYGNDKIGAGIYQPFFGTGSIVDEQSFRERRGTASGKNTSTPGGDLFANATEGEVGALSDFGGTISGSPAEDLTTVRTSRQEAGEDPDAPVSLEDSVQAKIDSQGTAVRPISIAQAVDTLSTIYGSLKAQEDMDVHRFIHRYTYRPIATMDEVLGHPEFSLDADGKPVRDTSGQVIGFEGFHSRAVSGLGELKGLALPSESGQDDVDPEMDPRPGRRARVVRYISELTGLSGSKGLLG